MFFLPTPSYESVYHYPLVLQFLLSLFHLEASHRGGMGSSQICLFEFCGANIGNGGQAFLRVFRFFPVSIIPPLLHTEIHVYAALTRRTNGQRLGSFQKVMFFRKLWSI